METNYYIIKLRRGGVIVEISTPYGELSIPAPDGKPQETLNALIDMLTRIVCEINRTVNNSA